MGEKAELCRRRQGDDDLFGGELEFFQGKGEFRLRLGFFPGGDLFAEAAGMPPIEGFRHRLFERAGAEILREHGGPGDGLQGHPMRAIDREQRDDHQDLAEPQHLTGRFGFDPA